MSTINWAIPEARLQTLLDRANFLEARADFLEALAHADFQHTMLVRGDDGRSSLCERPNSLARPCVLNNTSRKAALSQKEKVLAEYTKVNDEIEKVLKHLALREPEDAGTS